MGWPHDNHAKPFLLVLLFVLASVGCDGIWFTAVNLVDPGRELIFNDPAAPPTGVIAAGTPVFQQRPIFDSIPGKIGSHASTITAFGDGELLAAWYSYEGPHELQGSAIYMARMLSGQDAWSQPWLVIDRPEGDGNPVLYSEQDRVWLFHAVVPFGWSTSRIFVQQSTDRGHTWSEPKLLPGMLGANVRYPPVRTPEGTLLLPAYDEIFSRSVFFLSSDGSGWNPLGTIETGPQNIQPSVVRLPDGRLLAVMRNTGGGWLWVTDSIDSGHSWSPPKDSGFPNPGSAAGLLSLASGKLLLVFNDSPADRTPLSAAVSADGGVTWPVRKVLVQGDGTYSYPSAGQTPDGLIHILYSLQRDRIQHVTLNEAWLADPNAAATGP